MDLLPDDIRSSLPPLYAQDGAVDPIVYVKFFHPLVSWKWYALEGSKEGDDFIFFGWVYGDFSELGYFSLNELKSVNILGIGMQRDVDFKPTPLSEVKKLHEKPRRDDDPPIVVYII